MSRHLSSVTSLPSGQDATQGPVPAPAPAPPYKCQVVTDNGQTVVTAPEGTYRRGEDQLWTFAPHEHPRLRLPVVTLETVYWLEMEHAGQVQFQKVADEITKLRVIR